jgi:hypothetical protein
MKKTNIVLSLLLAGLFLAPTGALAQATRTWISGVGNDANPCSRTAPCKTFAGAISLTAAGGEIDTLDPGGFGAVTVTKAITLANEGIGEAGILVASTNGITVNCSTDPNCIVIIRGLQLDGGPIGSNSLSGVRFVAGGTLIVQNCSIRNFTGGSPNGYGINFAPSTGTSKLLVDDSTIVSNGQPGGFGGGIFIAPTGSANVTAEVRNTQASANYGFGIRVDMTGNTGGSAKLAVSNSETSDNPAAGIAMITGSSAGMGTATVSVDHTTITNNMVGINANGALSTMRIGSSTVTGNATGVKQANGSTMTSYGTNQINDNTAPGYSMPVAGPS